MVRKIDNISFVTSAVTSFSTEDSSPEVTLPQEGTGKVASFTAKQRNAFETEAQRKEYENLFHVPETTGVEEVTEQGLKGHNLVLYYSPGCPYCEDVLREMRRLGINIPLKNARNPAYKRELLQIGGKGQVPCLIVDGAALYDSKAIIAWLREHYGMHISEEAEAAQE